MDHQVAVVDQHPFGVLVTFQAGGIFAVLFEGFRDLVADGLDLACVRAGGDDEVVGEGGGVPDVQYCNVTSLLRFSGLYRGQPDWLRLGRRRFRFMQFFRPGQGTFSFPYRTTIRMAMLFFFLLTAVAFAADDSAAVTQARHDYENLRQQVQAGLQPASKLAEAQESIDDALDAEALDHTLYGHLELEKLSPSEADEMVNAATRRLARTQKKLDRARDLIASGVAAPNYSEDSKAEFDRRADALAQAKSRAALVMQMVEIARAETTPTSDAPLTGIWRPKEFVDGDHLLADSDIRDITLTFEKHFHEPLPVSARGMTEVHRALGFDHTGRVDVAVMPDSPEGVWLRKYLESKSIPYYAFRIAIPGKATGAHIHIGPGSTRLHVAD